MAADRLALVVALSSILGACSGARERPEPPSGAVDPGPAGLVTPSLAGGGTPDALDARAPAAAAGMPRPAAAAAAPGAHPPPEPVGDAAGAIVMTREHCEALGRKFAALTLEQGGVLGGVDAAGKQEAEGVGKTFADRCARDMAGKTVQAREYQCMLRARSPNDLLSCGK